MAFVSLTVVQTFLFQLTLDVPQLWNLQKAKALPQADLCSTLRLMQVSRLRHFCKNLQYKVELPGLHGRRQLFIGLHLDMLLALALSWYGLRTAIPV